MALVENIQRQDLDPIEVALSYQRLIDEIDLTQEELSDRVGKNRSTIANYLRLLKLDPIVQTGMRDGFLSMGHGRALINVDNTDIQLEVYEKILKDKLSVRETEALVRKIQDGDKTSKQSKSPKVDEKKQKALKQISSYFGAKVELKVNKKGNGKLIVPFSSDEDFQRIKKLIQGD
jgi:ParB family chromosome partitioning protein